MHPAAESSAPTCSNRTLALHLGLVVRISKAAGSNCGATIASTNRSGCANTSAVAASSGRFTPTMPPKALVGSPSNALCIALRQCRCAGRTARIVMLHHHRRRIRQRSDNRQRRIQIQQIVVRQFLAVQLPRGNQIRSSRRRQRIHCTLLMRILAVAQHFAPPQLQRDSDGGNPDSACGTPAK